MSTWQEFASKVLKEPDEANKLSEDAMEEVRAGAAMIKPKLVWVAQKL